MLEYKNTTLLDKKENAKSKHELTPQKEEFIKKNSDQANQFNEKQSSSKVSELQLKPQKNSPAVDHKPPENSDGAQLKPPENSYREWYKPEVLKSHQSVQNGIIFIKIFMFTLSKRLDSIIFSSQHYYYLNWILFHFFYLPENQSLFRGMHYTGKMITDFIGKFQENIQDLQHKINHPNVVETIPFFSKPLSYLEASKNLNERLDPFIDLYKNLLKKSVQRAVKNFDELHYSDFIWCSYTDCPIEWFNKEPENYDFEWSKNTDADADVKNSSHLITYMNGTRLFIDNFHLLSIPSPSPWMDIKMTSELLLVSLNKATRDLGESPVILHADCYDFKARPTMEPMYSEFYQELFSLGVFPSNTRQLWGPTQIGHILINNLNERYKKILCEIVQEQALPLEEFYLQDSQVKEELLTDSAEIYNLMNENPYSMKDFTQKFGFNHSASVLVSTANLHKTCLENLLDDHQYKQQVLLDHYITLVKYLLERDHFITNLKKKTPNYNLDFFNPAHVKKFYQDHYEQFWDQSLDTLQDLVTLAPASYLLNLAQSKNTSREGKEKPIKLLGPLNPHVNLTIFDCSLNLSTRTKAGNQKKSFVAARNRLAMFLLFFTGMHVSTLQNISLWQLQVFFSTNQQNSSKTTTPSNNTPNGFLVDPIVREKYLFQGFKLYEDYQFLVECMEHYALKHNKQGLHFDFSFFGQYNHFGKTCSRPNTNKIVNDLLRKAVKASLPQNTSSKIIQSYTSHSFRLYVCKYLIYSFGIPTAQRFMSQVSFTTTILYDFHGFSQETCHKISKGLASNEDDWGIKKAPFADQTIDQLCEYIANGIPIELYLKTCSTQLDDVTYKMIKEHSGPNTN